MGDETWLPIPGYEDEYEASDQGRIRSVDRVVQFSDGRRRHYRGQILKPRLTKYGYPVVGLRQRAHHVHRLVLETFVGPRPPDMQCRHLDDVKTNNKLANLVWGTVRENRMDSVRNGRHWNARKTHCSRGHEFTPENTLVLTKQGARICRACRADTSRRLRRRRRVG